MPEIGTLRSTSGEGNGALPHGPSHRASPRLYYLPLHIFCGRHLLAAKLRRASLDAAAGAVEEVPALSAKFAAIGPMCAFWCAPTAALPATI
jgi:hypothetical protein